MANYIRSIVSGQKARFRDPDLDVDLDLAYITDHVLVMGYPATGLEGYYRNRREDAKRFLEHRHGQNYWVFNFCPVSENAYDPAFFDGRVSRYPFPDHHAPPLAILPLVAREIRTWLDGSPDRVAVLHCKAGKGRSGTMACSYLLSQDVTPSAPKLERSLPPKEFARRRANEWMEVMPPDGEADRAEAIASEKEVGGESVNALDTKPPAVPEDVAPPSAELGQAPQVAAEEVSETPRAMSVASNAGGTDFDGGPTADTKTKPSPLLQEVLDLHTAARMRTSKDANKKVKAGVSIPSQRRWLYYWSLLLAQAAPRGFWANPPMPGLSDRKARITNITIRMREVGGVKMSLVRAANAFIDRTGVAKTKVPQGQVWVSLARYDDEFVRTLETLERETRAGDDQLGKRKAYAEEVMVEGRSLRTMFEDGKWDKGKMVRSFARMAADTEDVKKEEDEKDGKHAVYNLRPLTDAKWTKIKKQIADGAQPGPSQVPGDFPGDAEDPGAETDASLPEKSTVPARTTSTSSTAGGVIVEAHREVRVKLYIGQIFFGWLWFIPAFHLSDGSSGATRWVLGRKEVDFPLGAGEALMDVAITMEWVDAATTDVPERKASGESGTEPAGLAAGVDALAGGNVREAVEAVQAAED